MKQYTNYILLAAAIISLYFAYDAYMQRKEGCNCGGGAVETGETTTSLRGVSIF